VLIRKLKWEDEDEPDDLYDDDKLAFDGLRKVHFPMIIPSFPFLFRNGNVIDHCLFCLQELRTFIDSVLMIDQDLVTNTVHALALNTLSSYRNGVHVPWNEAELAVYLVFIYGEINKGEFIALSFIYQAGYRLLPCSYFSSPAWFISAGGKGRAAFCQAPTVPRERRKETDYSEYPLTTHGEMLVALVQSGISSYPHNTVIMQFFETVARYSDFFKVRKDCIMPTLEAMIDPRCVFLAAELTDQCKCGG
jgi:exportin-T